MKRKRMVGRTKWERRIRRRCGKGMIIRVRRRMRRR